MMNAKIAPIAFLSAKNSRSILIFRNDESTYKMADCSCEERNGSKTSITIPHLIQVSIKMAIFLFGCNVMHGQAWFIFHL